MSITGIASSLLSILSGSQNNQGQVNGFKQFQSELQQLGQDLQSGNLSAARQDFASLQQDMQQTVPQVAGHHHHFHAAGQQNGTSSQPTGSIAQEFSLLAQSLRGGNLQGAQQAFATLQNDLQQIGGVAAPGSGGAVTRAAGGGVNVTA